MKNMDLILAVGGAALATASVLGGLQLNYALKIKKFKKLPLTLPEGFTYTAHTGCVGTKANSLESFEAAVKHGANIVEFDLHFTAEGKPVLSHDDPVGGEIPLGKAFEKISHYADLKVNVDVKNTKDLGSVVALADEYGIKDRIFYTGIRECDVEAVRRDTPDVPYYLNVDVKDNKTEDYIAGLIEKVKDCGAIGINFNKKNASKALVDAFHANGLLVSVWTANSKPDIYRLLSLSPDNITTKRPDIMNKILQTK